MALVEKEQPLPFGGRRLQLVWDRLEKGDKVAFLSGRNSYYGSSLKLFAVDRTTATLIIMDDGSRWYRRNGQQQASSDHTALMHPQDDQVIDAQQQTEFRAFKRALEECFKIQASGYQELMKYGDAVDKVRASFQARIGILEGKRRKPRAD